MGAMTVRQILVAAFNELGVGAAGEPIESQDLADGQVRFNMMIDAFKAERIMIYQTLRLLFPLIANKAEYTIGPGGDFDVPTQPVGIVRAGFINTNVNPQEPLETPVHIYTDEEWAAVALKNLTSTIVYSLWYRTNYTQTAPIGLGTMFPYPVLTNNGTLALYLPQAIEEVADDDSGLATMIYVPPGYRRAFVAYMAVECADMFEMTPSASLVGKLARAMKTVRRVNSKAMILRLPKGLLDRAGRRGYNILTNQGTQ